MFNICVPNLLNIGTKSGDLFVYDLSICKWEKQFLVHDTFVQSSISFSSTDMLNSCQNGQLYVLNKETTMLQQIELPFSGLTIWDFVHLGKGELFVSYSGNVIHIISREVSEMHLCDHGDNDGWLSLAKWRFLIFANPVKVR